MSKLKKICIIAILSTFTIFSLPNFTQEASAASRVIAVTALQAQKIGSSFQTSNTISRTELVSFLNQVKRAEKDANLLNSIRFGIASSAITFPLKSVGISVSAGGASSILSYFVINKDLGSTAIQNTLNKSTSTTFRMNIYYKKGTRGQDVWYEARSVTLRGL